MPDDKAFMKLAIGLAGKGLGMTSPNPVVGAVIVKNGRIVAKGWHKKAGLEHAEISAIKKAGRAAAGSTLYVNLEPCDHFGRTPPCTEAIIRSGIKRVVAAMNDPNPLNDGRGRKRLRQAGIRIRVGVLEKEARRVNEVFIKYITKKVPFVIVKTAQSLDGKIATKTGDSKWISGESSRAFVHRLRGRSDAVMVGAGTIIKDDPLLTNRVKGSAFAKASADRQGSRVKGKQPIKVMVDSELRMPLNARIFSKESPAKTIIAATKKARKDRIKKFERIGAEVLILKDKAGKVDLRQLMIELGKKEITSILAEGGGELIGSLLEEGLVDKFLFFISPKIIGGRDAKTAVEGKGVSRIKQAIALKDVNYKKIDDDLLIEAYVHGHN